MSAKLKVGDLIKLNENSKDVDLRILNSTSFEARLIFENFANRKRIHRDALLMVRVFYAFFIKKGIPVKKSAFDRVFTELDRLGYGLIEKYPNGDLKAFMPEISLKYIGMTAQPVAKVLAPIPIKSSIKTVVITFDVNGKKCQAEVPIDKVAQFTAMIGN